MNNALNQLVNRFEGVAWCRGYKMTVRPCYWATTLYFRDHNRLQKIIGSPLPGTVIFVAGDEMYRFKNTGDVTLTDVHTQTTKVVGNFVIPPGGTYTFDLRVGLGMGLNGTTYNRIQTFIRAMIFVL